MSSAAATARRMLSALFATGSEDDLIARQRQGAGAPSGPSIRPTRRCDSAVTAAHWRTLRAAGAADETDEAVLCDPQTRAELPAYGSNIENCIGAVRVPVGAIGPLRINGLFAKGDHYVPLATTEATLVASYGRGAALISAAGGCAAAVIAEGIQRAPGFAFKDLADAGRFVRWVLAEEDTLRAAAQATTRYGKLVGLAPHIEGSCVYLSCTYTTGDAAGQNMVTIATEALCRTIEANCPVKPLYWFVETNLSGDKKATAMAFAGVRGRKVCAEVVLPAELVHAQLHATTARMHDYWRMSALGGVMSGSIGVQGHYANGLAALYLATGQDVACVAESAVGVTRFELRENNALYASVTLPNIVVGTVGGGTGLPTQQGALSILGLAGAGKARALAEVCAALCLAGELSIIGALAAGHFTRAHATPARRTRVESERAS
ncbi:MAG TPA: hydroxymethylglutaryl-CoA reductase [Caulobacteraceae bacterium]|jgi:hydroxymethylglutaryl-CoA reductase (NADPH)|nr:hydroxymethylglutaryl-CoA reductase [Caulobacteraceae bacterium]